MQYKTKITDWKTDKQALSEIRKKVFIKEQNVPEELEWDDFDVECTHVLVTDKNHSPIACGRMKADGHIGRMAVLKAYRKTGIGTAILISLLNTAKQKKLSRVYLHAQTSAISFYEKQGFEAYSKEFMDANIPHKSMQISI